MLNEQVGTATALPQQPVQNNPASSDVNPVNPNPIPQTPQVPPVSSPPPSMPSSASEAASTSLGGEPGGSSPLFKLIVVVAILSVVALVGALSYYLYTAFQTTTQQPPLTTKVGPSPTPPSGATPTLSESDNTSTIDQELGQTNLEDFEADFQALQAEIAGL